MVPFSSISAFFITLEDDWPNLSALFFKVSKSAEGAPPILVLKPNLSALDCFLVSEVRSLSLETTASVRFDKFWDASNLAARLAARSSSVHFLMVISSNDFSAFFSGLFLSSTFVSSIGASILAGLKKGRYIFVTNYLKTKRQSFVSHSPF